MAGLEDKDLYYILNRLGYEAGNLRFHMRNENDSKMAEMLFALAKVKSQVTESKNFHSQENMEPKHSDELLAERFITEAINQCEDPIDRIVLLQEQVRKLEKIQAQLQRIAEEQLRDNENGFSEIINSNEQ